MSTKTDKPHPPANVTEDELSGERFGLLIGQLFAVPKEEYDKEAAAVDAGKPIKADLSKPRGKH